MDMRKQRSPLPSAKPTPTYSPSDRPKTADKQGQDRPKTAERQQVVDRRRSFSRPRTATSANSAGRSKSRGTDAEREEIAMPTQVVEYTSGLDTYNFPTPSPRLPPPRSATTQPSSARSPLPVTMDDSPRIGVAIGSPREQAPHWGRTHTVDQVATQSSARPTNARAMTALPQVSETSAEQAPKRKGSWKNFGSLFGRKPSTKAAPEPLYKLQAPQEQEEQQGVAPTRTLHSAARQPPQPAFTTTSDSRSPLPSATERARAPSNTMTRGMARMEARAQADRTLFEENSASGKQTSRGMRTPSIIQNHGMSPAYYGSPAAPRSSEEIFRSVDATNKRTDSPLSVTDGSGPRMLDLDIPSHHMERYSIMFENFLSNSAERERRPSIIERRQSKLQKKRSLKRLDDATRKDKDVQVPAQPLQRSTTSPHLARMPSLTIKTGKKVRSPTTSPAVTTATKVDPPVTAVHKPNKLVKRSNTAPIQASSPVKHNFSKPRMVMVAEPAVDEVANTPPARGISMYSENSLPPTPTSGRDSGEESPLRPPPLPTTMKPSQAADNTVTWQMLNLNPNTTAVPKRKTSLVRQEPGNPYRRVKAPEDLESRVVQVSVARQVSVSKARKQVRQAVDAKQPLRPRVVELGKNRKSTMVLIEGGDE